MSTKDECVYQVGGAIGVGKTTLLESARREGCNTFPEILIQRQFADYIQDPRTHAFSFQIAMMQAACMRTVCARAMQNAGHVPTAIERGAQENKVFALANYAMGWMTPEQYGRYEGYVDDLLSQPQMLPTPSKSLQLFLWAPKHDLASRMDERARPGEEQYKEDYLTRLDEAYFAHILCSLHEEEGKGILPYIVVDWRNYGTWADIRRHVERQQRQQISYIEHAAVLAGGELFVDNTEAWRLMGAEQLATEAAALGISDPNFLRYRHRGVHKRFDKDGLHLDMSWYAGADTATHAFALAFYRDLVYEAMAMGLRINFHYHRPSSGTAFPPFARPTSLIYKLQMIGERQHSVTTGVEDGKSSPSYARLDRRVAKD